jgi:uncharacterized glyoxalase superfamily protein PhnB
MRMVELRVCVDVDDLDRAIAFYCAALGLAARRRLGDEWAELAGATSVIDLLVRSAGTPASPRAVAPRSYDRHWTPVHLDVTVTDLDSALRRALDAGAVLEQEVQTRRWGRMANLADPFGHGLCLLEFRGRGYDELLGG